jgi:hypothetical protein
LEANKTNPSRGSAKADPSQSLLSERRPGPAEHPHDHAHSSPSAHGPRPDAGSGDPAYKGQWVKAGRRVGRPGLQGIFFGGNPAAAGSGRSEPWRRTNPSPRAAARKLILPRASSASEGTVPRSAPTTTPTHDPSAHGPRPDAGSGDPAYKGSSSGETPAAAGSGRSEPWRRTNPFPRAAARKLILPRASSASAGPVPRSTPTTTPIHPHPLMDRGRTPGQATRPTRDNGSKRAAGSGDPAYKGSSSGETQRQRDRAGASLGGEQTHPLARQRES